AFPAGNYFEFHVKVLLPPGADLAPLRALCQEHGAHLSSNALKQEQDGRSERFATLRVYGVGRTAATERFEALVSALRGAGYRLANTPREDTLYPSHIPVHA